MVSKPKRAALYVRVSTDQQTCENQQLALEAICAQRGWRVVGLYDDNGISGAKGRDKRPKLDALLKDAARGKFDVVCVWALDRLGRSLAHLIDILDELKAANVDLFISQQAIDTTVPNGRLFFHMLGAFSEFEREMIRSRVNAGLARARAKGKRLGRPVIGREKDSDQRAERLAKLNEARRLLAAGDGVLKTARAVGLGNGTVQRLKQSMHAQDSAES